MFFEEVKTTIKGKTYTSKLIRESYREGGKVKHRTLCNLSKLPAAVVNQVKLGLKGKSGLSDISDLENGNVREYGASAAFFNLAEDIGLVRDICSTKTQWRGDVTAMIVGRILFQGSKLNLVNQHKSTALWEMAGHACGVRPDVEKHCYEPMDELLKRKNRIERKLAKKHLRGGCVVLYDITNTWFEGEYKNSEKVVYGKGKGGKVGYKQIALGLLTSKEGCPVGVEVFKGSVSDQTTVLGQVKKLSKKYGIEEVVFTGDRGMLTAKRVDEISETDFKVITALTHHEMKTLLEKEGLQKDLFDEKNITEVLDSEDGTTRYALCKNEKEKAKEAATRASMLDRINSLLAAKAAVKKKRNPRKVAASVGRIFAKYRLEKFYEWTVDENGGLAWNIRRDKVESEEQLDGCYVIKTTAPADMMSKEEFVLGYRQLQKVEQAFKQMKTVMLEMRPVFHKKDERIEAHIFIVMLAYYLQWHAAERLKPILEEDGEGKNKRLTFATIVQRLKSICKVENLIAGVVVKTNVSKPDKEQARIIELLGVKLA